MGETTGIEWTDATVNFWWGCTKVGPGCDHCYAETHSARFGGEHWGVGAARKKIKSAVKLLHRLDNQYSEWAADYECAAGNAKVFGRPPPNFLRRRRVFIQSMSDLFDLEVPLDWFDEAWATISACNRLDIQIVTKRVSAVEKRITVIGSKWPPHAGLIVTVVNQDEADRDVPRLLALKAKLGIPWVGLSIEPILGPVDLTRIVREAGGERNVLNALAGVWQITDGEHFRCGTADKLDWVIVGGESGPDARPMHPDWARSIRDQCAAAGVPFHFKQHGEWIGVPDLRRLAGGDGPGFGVFDHCKYDQDADAVRVGKKRAGRLLDGVTHDGRPS